MRSSYLHNGNPCTGKMTSLYWIRYGLQYNSKPFDWKYWDQLRYEDQSRVWSYLAWSVFCVLLQSICIDFYVLLLSSALFSYSVTFCTDQYMVLLVYMLVSWLFLTTYILHMLLTHLSLVPHICITELGRHWFREWLVACSAPSHYLNQHWVIVNLTPRNKLQWNFNQNTKLFIHENASKNIVCKMAAILSWGRWVKQIVLCLNASIHWKAKIVMISNLLSLMELQVLIMTTDIAASDNMTTQCDFQC